MAFHQTIVHGRIGKEISLTYSQSGVAIAKFSIAVSEKYNGEEKTTWYNVTAFKSTAENISKFFDKGSEIIVIGNMQFGIYDKDGVTVKTSDLIVRSFDFCGSKQQTQGKQNQQPNQGGFQNTGQQGFQNNQQNNSGFQNSNNHQQPQQGPQDDHIPFACNIV